MKADRTPRERMVRSAALLMRTEGLSRTGMREIAEFAEAPRGSLQHYFPGGKEQVVSEALEWVAEQASRPVLEDAERGASPRAVVTHMFDRWRTILEHTDFLAGCPIVATVADAVSNDALRSKSAQAFAAWRAALVTAFRRGGLTKGRAERLAVVAIAALEGAIVLARADADLAAYDLVAKEIAALAATRELERAAQR
jgi:AcrR family transcriptional regulator